MSNGSILDENVLKAFSEVFEALDIEDDAARIKALPKGGGNPFADYIRWQVMDDDTSEKNIKLIEHAVDVLSRPMRSALERVEAGESGELRYGDTVYDIEDVFQLYAYMLSDLAGQRYFSGDKEAAAGPASEFMKFNVGDSYVGASVHYALMIEKEQYGRVIEEADSGSENLPSAHCRAIALFETEGSCEEASDAMLAAISLDPDINFYILGVWEIDLDDIDEEQLEEIDPLLVQSSVLHDLWSKNDERLAFFSRHVFAIGYLTGRIDDEDEIAAIEEGYKLCDSLDEMRAARDEINAMIAAGKDYETVDEEAVMAFIKIREKGNIMPDANV